MPYLAETPRLWLEKLTVEDHLEGYWEIWRNPKALTWSTYPAQETIEQARALMVTMLATPERPTIEKYAILLRPVAANEEASAGEGARTTTVDERGRPRMVGMVGMNRTSPEGMEVGYCMNYEFWGRGYAGEAFRGFLEGFWKQEHHKDLAFLVAKVDPENIPSVKIVTKSGGREGELIESSFSRHTDGDAKRQIRCWYFDRPGTEP